MATDGQIVVAAARWSDEGLYLKDLVASDKFPAVAKIVKGQYGGLGVPSLPNPGLQSIVLLHSVGKRRKIFAQAVKIKEGRRVVGVGPRIEIPDTYSGYFELLSEEGRAMRSIESVLELSKRRTENGCLVREPIRAIIAKYDSDGNLVTNGARIVLSGEIIYPKSELQLQNHKARFLHCCDAKGDNVLLSIDQRGKFSVLAKEDNISGVHTTKNLFSKRMPLTVRLVHGPPAKGLKSSSSFIPELRLLAVAEEESLYAMSLQKDTGNVIPLPISATLRLQPCRNGDVIEGMKEFQRLADKCAALTKEILDRPYILDTKLSSRDVLNMSTPCSSSRTGYFLRRSASLDSPSQVHPRNCSNENRAPVAAGDDYDDIDQIYDYVRGFAPLPKNVRSPFADPSTPGETATGHSPTRALDKPEPPPIETIPSKKPIPSNKAEKRSRRNAAVEPFHKSDRNVPSLYVKNSHPQRGRILRQKSASPLKEPAATPLVKSSSPVVNCRYKSLSNLQLAMEMDGTLDSSHSGGRTSGDSGACAKLPEKRSRRLSRPLSLTNLVWEICKEPVRTEHHSRKPPKSSNQPFRIGTLYL